MKVSVLKFLTPAIAGIALGLLPNGAKAQSQYFTTVATGQTYSWDAANWNASGSTGNTGPYTSTWTSGDFARFVNGASDTFTVTVNASENNTGIYNDASGSTININDAGSGTGNLAVSGAVQGYLSLGTTMINVPITGTGGIAPELSGSIYLNVANTYIGGTALGDSGNTLTFFNNNSAFSSGGITLNRTGNFSTLLGTGGAPLAIANNFSTVVANTGPLTELNFAASANTPVTSSGTWTLGTVNLNLRSSGGSTAPLTLSGAISGTGNLILSANGTGNKTILSGASPSFTGTITATGSGGTYGGSGAITLQFGVANALASATGVTLSGGTVSLAGFNQNMSSAALTISGPSTIDFSLGGKVQFADSSSQTWTGPLDLTGWTTADNDSAFEIGTSASGLTASQLNNDVEFNGVLGEAALDASGYLYAVPEPSSIALAFLGGLGVCWMRRRKA